MVKQCCQSVRTEGLLKSPRPLQATVVLASWSVFWSPGACGLTLEEPLAPGGPLVGQ